MTDQPIKVFFVQRFMLHYRIALLERINAVENLDLTLIHGRGIENSKFVNYDGHVNFRHEQLRTIRYSHNGRGVVYFPSLFRRLVREKPDVVVVEGESNILNNVPVYFYSLLYRKRIIWWGLGLIPGYSETLFQKIYRPFMKNFLRRSSAVIGYSQYSKDYYSRFTGNDKIVVANNCLDNERIDREIEESREASVKLKKELGLEGRFVMLYVGGFADTKRVDKLLYAYRHIREKYPESALVLVAGGRNQDVYEKLAQTLGLKDVIFAGTVIEGVSKYFLLADLFILPGLGGLSIYHAMVHSLPVIAAKADGTERDLIEEGKNGFILKTDTVEELAENMEKFLADQAMAKRFGIHSREIVENKINISRKVQTFVGAISGSVNHV